jgi:hypothetical protein
MAQKTSHKGMPKAHGKGAHGHMSHHKMHHGPMKKSHEHAMHHSHHAAKAAHDHRAGYHNPMFATGLGVSEAEAPAMGHGNFANMPQDIYMEQYPKAPAQRSHVLDDTISHIDRCNHHAEEMESKFLSNQH